MKILKERMFLNIAKMPLKKLKFMAAFRNLFNKSALSVTYIDHYVKQHKNLYLFERNIN